MRQKQWFPECVNLCLIGDGVVDGKAALEWLEGDGKRRLFWIGCANIGPHPRLRIYSAEVLFLQKMAANEIGWSTVAEPLEIRTQTGWELLEALVRESHLASGLIFSRVRDFGLTAFSHARVNWKKGPFVSLSSLKGSLRGVPAIVAGAGPSLESALPSLRAASLRALVIGSGTALSLLGKWGAAPHLACAVDEKTPAAFLQSCKESLFCVQSQLNPAAMAQLEGRKILAAEEGVLPWESWWLDGMESIDGGCTVGNFATAAAVYLGCNPIVLVGMDLCYRGEIKYAEEHSELESCKRVETANRLGRPVLTQPDWLLAARWHQRLSARHSERRFFSTGQEGLFLGDSVEVVSWEEALSLLGGVVDAKKRLEEALQLAPEIWMDPKKEKEWEKSIVRALAACRAGNEGEIEEEVVYRTYLAPLWNLWRPVMERQGNDLLLQRRTFFVKILSQLGTAFSP